MNFDFTEEQNLLRESARKLMAREITPVIDQHGRDRLLTASIIKSLLKKLIPLGYVGGIVPQELGGGGLSWVTYGALMEELDPSLGVSVNANGVIMAYTLAMAKGKEDLQKRFLPLTLSGDILACLASSEPNAGSNPAEIQTTAVRDGNDWIINGTKLWITHGSIADVAVTIASVDRSLGSAGLAMFLVEKERSPFKSRDIPTMGLCHDPVSELVFEDCRVPSQNMLGEPGKGYAATLRVFQVARCLLVGFGALAIAKRSLEASIRYAQERQQFGRPIGSFQLIQEMISEMATETDAARLLLYRALHCMDRNSRVIKETSMAKWYASEAAFRIASKAVQIHGGYGLSKEFPLERYFRDARMYTIPDGSSEIQKLIIARELLGLGAFC